MPRLGNSARGLPLAKTLLASVVALVLVLGDALPALGVGEATRKPALTDQLYLGLRVKTPDEREFIDRVVALVETGKLPRSLVDRVFFWARSRAARKREAVAIRPMIYFRPGLTILARRIGVIL